MLENQKAVLAIFQNERMANVDIARFDLPQSVYIDVIMKGDAIGIRAIAGLLTIKNFGSFPSIKYLISSGYLKERNVIVLLTMLIDLLSKFFEKETSKSMEELAYIVYDDYKWFTVEDLIKFFDLCKRKHFASDFQHINSRGVNAEFLLDWLEKYIVLKSEEIRSQVFEFRNRPPKTTSGLNDFDRSKINEIGAIKAKKQLQQQKISKLQKEFNQGQAAISLGEKLVRFLAEEELWFMDEHCFLSFEARWTLGKSKGCNQK